MVRSLFLCAASLMLFPCWLLGQNKPASKKTTRKYAFYTMPMFTGCNPVPTKEQALKNAMRVFLMRDDIVAASVKITACKVTKTENLRNQNIGLPEKLPDGTINANSLISVKVKYCEVTWNVDFTVTKDISIWSLWEKESMLDFRPLSYFQRYLTEPFKSKMLKSIYDDHQSMVFKAGEKISLVGLHAKMIGPADDENWTCIVLNDFDKHDAIAVASIALKKATTLDAKSVSVDYEIKDANAISSHFEIYRSTDSTIHDLKNLTPDANLVKLGDTTLIATDKLTKGEHDKVTILSKTELLPDTRMPYIIVVASYNDKKVQVYFRKWMLGAVVHGFDRWALHESPLHRLPDWLWRSEFQNFTEPSWETTMASQLKTKDGYDEVIACDWMQTCGLKQHGWAEQAGEKLAGDIVTWIRAHEQHPGDVVDIHLIGHSRGTVVVSQALQTLATKLKTNNAPFGGSYVELTLLDPHPANNMLDVPWASWAFNFDAGGGCQTNFKGCAAAMEKMKTLSTKEIQSMSPDELKRIMASCGGDDFIKAYIEADCENNPVKDSKDARDSTINFQLDTKDSRLSIVSGVKKIDVFFQHTSANQLCTQPDQEFIQNLWGMVSPTTLSSLDGTIAINKTDLTNADIDGIGVIGHNEVPLVYEQLWVDSGTLNRSPKPVNTNIEPSN